MAEAKSAKATSKEGKGGENGSVPTEYPIVEVQGAGARELEGRVDPKELAKQLKAIRDAFVDELSEQRAGGAYALEWLELSLTIGVEGTVGL